MTTSKVRKKPVYHSIFGYQLASVTMRPALVRIHIQCAIYTLIPVIDCLLNAETGTNKGGAYLEESRKETNLSKFMYSALTSSDLPTCHAYWRANRKT